MQYLCECFLKEELIKTSGSWYDSLDLFYTSRLVIVPQLPWFGFEHACMTLLVTISSYLTSQALNSINEDVKHGRNVMQLDAILEFGQLLCSTYNGITHFCLLLKLKMCMHWSYGSLHVNFLSIIVLYLSPIQPNLYHSQPTPDALYNQIQLNASSRNLIVF